MNLSTLKPKIEGYIEFARQFPGVYRPAILSYLLELDLTARPSAAHTVEAAAAPVQGAAPRPQVGSVDPGLVQLAAELELHPRALGRMIEVSDGKPVIKWMSYEKNKSKKMIEYAVLYAYIAEKMGMPGVPVEDVRKICVEKRCYDGANFLAILKRNPEVEVQEIGGRRQEIVLTPEGRDHANQIIDKWIAATPAAFVRDEEPTDLTAEVLDEGDDDDDAGAQ